MIFRLSSSWREIAGISLKAINSSKKVLKITGSALSRMNSVIISARTVVNFSFARFDVDNVEMKKLDCLKRELGEGQARPGEAGRGPGEERARKGRGKGEDGGVHGCERAKEENTRVWRV